MKQSSKDLTNLVIDSRGSSRLKVVAKIIVNLNNACLLCISFMNVPFIFDQFVVVLLKINPKHMTNNNKVSRSMH